MIDDSNKKDDDKELIKTSKNPKLEKSQSQEDKILIEGDKQDNEDLLKKYGFVIDVKEIEELMGKYKERGNDYKDLSYFEEHKGIDYLINSLKTSPQTGIESLEGREEVYGSNKVFVEPVPHFCHYVLESLDDLMVKILIGCAFVSIILGCTISDDPSKDWIDGVSIVVAILVVVLVGSITNYQKEQKFHELNEIKEKGTVYKVIRNGKPIDLVSDDLLVGDLMMINYGEIMPADIFLFDGNGVKMDESALTGESDAMKKESYQKCMEIKNSGSSSKIPSPLILSGTHCIEGSGKGIILAVGDHSQKGIIRRTIDNANENSQTPLEAKLERIAELIGYFGLGAGIVTFVALLIRFAVSLSQEISEYEKDKKVESAMNAILQNSPFLQKDKKIRSNSSNDLSDPKKI